MVRSQLSAEQQALIHRLAVDPASTRPRKPSVGAAALRRGLAGSRTGNRWPRSSASHAASRDTSESMWTVPLVAEFLSCSTTTVYRLTHEGALPAYRLSGRLLFDPAEVRAALQRA
jgi:excisionase family DNA binding protein